MVGRGAWEGDGRKEGMRKRWLSGRYWRERLEGRHERKIGRKRE